MMFEITTGEQPFRKYKKLEFEKDKENNTPLSQTLESYRRKYSNDEFVMWTLDWMTKDMKRFARSLPSELLKKKKGICNIL